MNWIKLSKHRFVGFEELVPSSSVLWLNPKYIAKIVQDGDDWVLVTTDMRYYITDEDFKNDVEPLLGGAVRYVCPEVGL